MPYRASQAFVAQWIRAGDFYSQGRQFESVRGHMQIHIHNYSKWETIRIPVEQYITGYLSKSEEIVQLKTCSVCGKGKKRKP